MILAWVWSLKALNIFIKNERPCNGFFQFEIMINVLVSSFRSKMERVKKQIFFSKKETKHWRDFQSGGGGIGVSKQKWSGEKKKGKLVFPNKNRAVKVFFF